MIIAAYAGLLALVFLALAAQVIKRRRKVRIGIGDGGDLLLQKAIRAHGNFAEYVPFTLLLLAILEWQGAAGWVLHLLGLSLLVGRICHAYGISQRNEQLNFRIAGMLATFAVMGIAAVWLVGCAVFG